MSTSVKEKKTRAKIKKILKLGGAYAVTLPREFAADAEYVAVIEAENGLFIKKVRVLEDEGPLPPLTPYRRRGEAPGE